MRATVPAMRLCCLGVTIAAALALSSCASSSAKCGDDNCTGPSEGVDAANLIEQTDGAIVDAWRPPDADTTDAGPRLGLGERCSDRDQCASRLCILLATGGICTKTCISDSTECPDGFGCVGVLGGIDPGNVVDVCVPETSQLCTTCTEHSECSLLGMDRCIDYGFGKKFCGRDCATIECPSGYTCEVVETASESALQCVPESGACDCNAELEGAREECDIATPFGQCEGQRLCQGETGWRECEPPSQSDLPDGAFVDDNCDGIDGDRTAAIFVAVSGGVDGADCGTDYTDPCQSIGFGIIRRCRPAGDRFMSRPGPTRKLSCPSMGWRLLVAMTLRGSAVITTTRRIA